MSQQNSQRLIEQWINAKFDGKIVLSLVQRGPYLNPQFSIINGKEYQTKLGKATQVQIGLGDLRQLVETANQSQRWKMNFLRRKIHRNKFHLTRIRWIHYRGES